MVKAALVCAGGPKWPDGEKLGRAGVSRLYYEAKDPQIDPPFFNQLRKWGYEVGIMRDPSWASETPEMFIAKVNADIALFAPKGPEGKRPQLAVMLDIERHDEEFVRKSLLEFQRTNPGRNVIWTLEYHQGGWFSQALVDLINAYPQLRVLPQCYYGDMNTAVDTHAAARDLYQPHGGVNDNRICFFYTCRVPIPLDWDGCLFLENWGQLP